MNLFHFLSLFYLYNDVSAAVAATSLITTKCLYYNETSQAETVEVCPKAEEGKRNHCYVLWQKTDNDTVVKLKGCFLDNEDCYNKSKCIANTSKQYMYCCCEGDLCNKDFHFQPKLEDPTPTTTKLPVLNDESTTSKYIILGVIPIVVFLTVGIIVSAFYLKRRIPFSGLPTSDPNPMPPSPLLDKRPIQLIEVKATGQYGTVWRAQYATEEVAVKKFSIQHKHSWQSEQEIFKLPFMNHPNILRFIGVEKRGDNLHAEFWLITAYHERGSLCDFLKAHTVTWNELCKIAETMARGLMHLHEAIPAKSPKDLSKPAIAHRDFKSKNVLLKNDMTACIADFGLAIVFEPGESCGNTHGQVGTRRYMAPEVLEGAINFTLDAFLRIDMYACGLVLWELVSRCTAQDGPIPEYRLPFEEEVGQHPSLEDMQESVVQRKVRPIIQEHWRHHAGLSLMCDTMEECWDHDAEARLSASCVMERVMLQTRYPPANIGWRIENETPLSPLKENSI